MNYYQHHIGDFNNATRHLTRVERSIYRDLIDLYYDKETPVPTDVERVFKLVLAHSDDEKAAVLSVLEEFFELRDDGWHQARCDAEIDQFHTKTQQASNAGKASAAKRLNRIPTPVEIPLPSGSTTQDPLPNTQEPDKKPGGKKKPPKPVFTALPENFGISERVRKWAEGKGFKQLEQHLEHFVSYIKRNGKTYVDWDEALMGCIREDWAKVRVGASGAPLPNAVLVWKQSPDGIKAKAIELGLEWKGRMPSELADECENYERALNISKRTGQPVEQYL